MELRTPRVDASMRERLVPLIAACGCKIASCIERLQERLFWHWEPRNRIEWKVGRVRVEWFSAWQRRRHKREFSRFKLTKSENGASCFQLREKPKKFLMMGECLHADGGKQRKASHPILSLRWTLWRPRVSLCHLAQCQLSSVNGCSGKWQGQRQHTML